MLKHNQIAGISHLDLGGVGAAYDVASCGTVVYVMACVCVDANCITSLFLPCLCYTSQAVHSSVVSTNMARTSHVSRVGVSGQPHLIPCHILLHNSYYLIGPMMILRIC